MDLDNFKNLPGRKCTMPGECLDTSAMAGLLHISPRQLGNLVLEPGCPAIDAGTGEKRMYVRWPVDETIAWMRERKERKRRERVQTTPEIEALPPEQIIELGKRKRGRPRKTPDEVLLELRRMRLGG